MSVSRIAPAAPLGSSPGAEPRTAAFLERAEVRDVLAWMRLLVDPQDAAAVVRALARPPIELRQVDLARVIQVARRGKLDMVSALTAATDSPQVPPEARERIQGFLALHRSAAAGLDTVRPDVFAARLIERLGMRRRQLIAPEDAAAQRASLAALRGLAADFLRQQPRATPRELAHYLAAISKNGLGEGEPLPVLSEGEPAAADRSEIDQLEQTLQTMRREVLDSVARIGGRLGELRLDTELDISHGVVKYLELVKLAALLQRPSGEGMEESLRDLNVRLQAAATPLQREIFETSSLDELLLADLSQSGPHEERARAQALAGRALIARDEPSLEAFLPRRGEGLLLSASDIELYRSCPLRYKFARVLRIPSGSTLNQRFGITVHQVLERYHSADGQTLPELLDLLEAAWRRGGFGESERERQLLAKACTALTRYHERLCNEPATPLWFERAFTFSLGPHHLRGRVDRVDRLPDGRFELIDYKTGYPKTAAELQDDMQLSLYAIAAQEAWQLEDVSLAYHYMLDDRKVQVPRRPDAADWVKDTVLEVGAGILAQDFEPTPSPPVCALCDYRIACPAAET